MDVLKRFVYEEDGLTTIEIGIILAVLIALAVVFRKQVTALWNAIVEQLNPKDAVEKPALKND